MASLLKSTQELSNYINCISENRRGGTLTHLRYYYPDSKAR